MKLLCRFIRFAEVYEHTSDAKYCYRKGDAGNNNVNTMPEPAYQAPYCHSIGARVSLDTRADKNDS